MFKKISVIAVVVVMMLSVFSLCASATELDIMAIPFETNDFVYETAPIADIVDDIVDGVTATDEVKTVQFRPMAFVENLNIMGVGMLGIFVVIGAIILSVVVLGKFTAPKPEKKDE